jgi:hypothetical protein
LMPSAPCAPSTWARSKPPSGSVDPSIPITFEDLDTHSTVPYISWHPWIESTQHTVESYWYCIYIYTWQNDVKSFNSFRMHRVDFFCLLFPIGSCGFSAWGHHLGAAEEAPRQGGSSNSGSHAESCWVML